MLKELIIKKDDVVYGETGAGANVTKNTIGSLADGSFAVLTADDQLVTRTGTVGTVANVNFKEPFTLYVMENSQLRAIPFIGKGRADTMGSVSAAAKTLTFDVDNFPTSRTELKPTGLIIQDADKNPHDPKARTRVELPVDNDVTAAGASNFEGDLATLLGEVDGISTATGNGSGVITITLDAGRNLQFIATGYLEGVSLTVTQALAYASTLSAAELLALEKEVLVNQGRTQDDLVSSQVSDMFTKASSVETGLTYYVFFIKYIHHSSQYVDGAVPTEYTMCIASPDSVPGGSDADGTWAALIGAMADPASNLS